MDCEDVRFETVWLKAMEKGSDSDARENGMAGVRGAKPGGDGAGKLHWAGNMIGEAAGDNPGVMDGDNAGIGECGASGGGKERGTPGVVATRGEGSIAGVK